jgi:hypothetical protein
MAKKGCLWLGCTDEKVKRPEYDPFRHKADGVQQIRGNSQWI